MKQLVFFLLISCGSFGQSDSGPVALHEIKPRHITDMQIGFQGSVPSFSGTLRPGAVLSFNRSFRKQFAIGMNFHYTFSQVVSADTTITILHESNSNGIHQVISSVRIDRIRHSSLSGVLSAAYRTKPLQESAFVFRLGIGTGVSMFHSRNFQSPPSYVDLISRFSMEYEFYRMDNFAFVPALGFQYRLARKDKLSYSRLSKFEVFAPFFTITLKVDLASKR